MHRKLLELPIPNYTTTTTPNSQIPTSIESCWALGVGNWEWLAVGSWALGIDLLEDRRDRLAGEIEDGRRQDAEIEDDSNGQRQRRHTER